MKLGLTLFIINKLNSAPPHVLHCVGDIFGRDSLPILKHVNTIRPCSSWLLPVDTDVPRSQYVSSFVPSFLWHELAAEELDICPMLCSLSKNVTGRGAFSSIAQKEYWVSLGLPSRLFLLLYVLHFCCDNYVDTAYFDGFKNTDDVQRV
jgi:hypothetical protein